VRRLAAIPLVFLAACGWFSGHTRRYQPPGIQAVGQPVTGEEWFQRDCAFCHGNRGQGTPRGPNIADHAFAQALADFMVRTGRMPIADPRDVIRRQAPAYPPDVIAKIVAFVGTLNTQGDTGVPEPDIADGNLAHGQELFQANCAACHSATGIGGTLAKGRTVSASENRTGFQIPSLLPSTPLEIAEAMRAGPGTMPVFSQQQFSDHDVNSIARYILYMRTQNRGGATDLGRIGPVAEGAVGWIVGLGLLLLFTRWIGRTVREKKKEH
jgi:ubiquinol-cytochrome c reductase cytochrome c subunit